jgi:hypothetical protein
VALQQMVPKAQVWIVAEATTSHLNFIVSTCVMNESKGHWVLLDALTTTIALIINMEATLLPLSSGLKISESFENEIFTL